MKNWIIGIVVITGLAMAIPACTSTPTTDPDNGVSNVSYRLCITKVESNVASIASKMGVAKLQDQNSPTPVHSAAWWDSLIGELRATDGLCVATLKGAGN